MYAFNSNVMKRSYFWMIWTQRLTNVTNIITLMIDLNEKVRITAEIHININDSVIVMS